MKRVIALLFCVSAIIASNPAEAFLRQQVGEPIDTVGKDFQTGEVFDASLSVWIEITDNGDARLIFQGGTASNENAILGNYDSDLQQRLENQLAKSIEWIDVAKNNNADTQKLLGCFGIEVNTACENSESPTNRFVALTFWAVDSGQSAGLLVEIYDLQSQNEILQFFLVQPQLDQFQKIVEQIPAAMEQARQSANKQDLFQ